ncbi:hypothetical protein CYLTODRAFT_443283 [Cylindrobasidium torrendii FP15055 ss-10]|uniref:Uncharacterized protein n=1 Tax=Cylindrobasidium torrendii FP15055 ss-10 TaxID=1314674 RepID=A0A0D7BDI9_9AGAR|nr:hypothetical protein CYLTODRAFT_443283 [Cylindrobasidium torrendii FP15055 ss-10]
MPKDDKPHSRVCPLCEWKPPPTGRLLANKLVNKHIRRQHPGHLYHCNSPGCTTTVSFPDRQGMKRHAERQHGGVYQGETLHINVIPANQELEANSMSTVGGGSGQTSALIPDFFNTELAPDIQCRGPPSTE